MATYMSCQKCYRLIDLYPPPGTGAQSGIMWNQPVMVDTTVTINDQRYCENCGKNMVDVARRHNLGPVPGYRIDSGGTVVSETLTVSGELNPSELKAAGYKFGVDLATPVEDLPSPELANKTFTVASGVAEVSIGELDDVANGGKSERVKLVTPVEDSKE